MTENETPAVLCGIPVSYKDYKPKEDFQEIACDNCGEMCWIGPRQLSVKIGQPMDFLCVFCVRAKYGENAFEFLAHLGG